MRLRSRFAVGLAWMGLLALTATMALPVEAASRSEVLLADMAATLEAIQRQIARLQDQLQGVTTPAERARIVEQIQELERSRAALLEIQASLHGTAEPSGPERVDAYQARRDWRADTRRERADRILERPDRLP